MSSRASASSTSPWYRGGAGGTSATSRTDIKWRPNLTINAGLRYEYYSVVEEKDGRAKVWRMSCGGFCPQGTSWYQPDKNNFAPRVGFAWSPPQNVACRHCEYASTNQDIRHTVTTNWVYQLPFGKDRRYQPDGVLGHFLGGWNFSGLLQARTGRPLTISVTRSTADLPDGNNSGQRADIVAGVPPIPENQAPAQWLNLAAFAVPARGTWGNLGRNTFRGPELFQVDLALQRRLQISGDRNFELGVEAFNAFNQQNLANPNTNISSGPAFGRITGPLNLGYGTGTARQMQFMARFNF